MESHAVNQNRTGFLFMKQAGVTSVARRMRQKAKAVEARLKQSENKADSARTNLRLAKSALKQAKKTVKAARKAAKTAKKELADLRDVAMQTEVAAIKAEKKA